MKSEIHTLDVVALTEDIPEHGLCRGQVGTVVETLSSDLFEVEFVDNDGRTYATLPLKSSQLLVLYFNQSSRMLKKHALSLSEGSSSLSACDAQAGGVLQKREASFVKGEAARKRTSFVSRLSSFVFHEKKNVKRMT